LKFWLHISKDEQLRRFKGREKTSYKSWKITEEDWRNREKWDLYKDAVEDMITMTSTEASKWNVIAGNSKRSARIKVMEIIIEELERALKKREK
jgi:polyphosphate kinase 2 (PPK2 family)